jgi:flagellar hook-length control protein FliK
MQADFCGFQSPFSNSMFAGSSVRAESAASEHKIGGNGSQSADNNGFLGIIARLLGKPLQSGSFAPGAESTAPVPGDPAVADLSDQDTLLLQAAMEIGLDPEYLKNLVAAGEAPTGSEPWQSLQTLLETLSLRLQQSEEPMPFSRLQALSTILTRIAELVSSKLETPEPLPSTPTDTTGAVELPASSESVFAGLVKRLNELLAAVRSGSASSAGLEQSSAVMSERAGSDAIGPQNFSQSNDTLDSRPADVASRGEKPGNTLLQQQIIWAHEKPWLQTQAESLKGSPAAKTDSSAGGHAVLTGTADKPGDDSATSGFKQPLSTLTAAADPPSSAGLNGEQKTLLVADPASGQGRPGVGDTQPVIEETKIKLVDVKESEGFGWSQSSGDRSAESAPAARVDPQARGALQSEALQQIIQKASVHLQNGQNEVKIELKPEFLGHIRMQIVTENHQVTLRVLTEFPMVKDLIEHNIQHLRAELQQHGLKMDVLNVSVANDSQTSAGGQWHTPRGKAGFRGGHAASGQRQPANESTAVTPAPARRSGNSAIDYFI